MTLIDEDRAHELYDAMGPAIEISGGSAANTMVGLASFGTRPRTSARCATTSSARCSRTTSARPASTFRSPAAADGPSTGRCLIVVTPDAQRTMNTYLGASAFLGPEDVDADLVAAARVVYLEGYLWDRPRPRRRTARPRASRTRRGTKSR